MNGRKLGRRVGDELRAKPTPPSHVGNRGVPVSNNSASALAEGDDCGGAFFDGSVGLRY